MTTLRTAAQQALEALEEWHGAYPHRVEEDDIEVAEALRAALVEDAMQKFTDVNQELEAALAEPGQEPVAWCSSVEFSDALKYAHSFNGWRRKYSKTDMPLYTAPPQRKPLSEEEIMQCFADAGAIVKGQLWVKVARAIERAHGIGGNA